MSCRLVRGGRIRCTVRNARAGAAVVAKRGKRVVRRARAGRRGAVTFQVARGNGRFTVRVAGRVVRS